MPRSASTNAVTAAVVRQKGGPFVIEKLRLEEPRADEVLVRIVATGMCHTDMVVRDQVYPVPQPIVLGHEGAGVVEKVGPSVVKVRPGDHVVLTFMSCGRCRMCAQGRPANCENFNAHNFSGARADGTGSLADEHGPIHDHFFGQSSFSTFAVANERNVVKVPKEAPLELLGPLGCGIQTGAGAVMNALKVGHGDSFAAFGAGAVGLSAVMAARAIGATTIIAVDVVPARLALARDVGATHAVDARKRDPIAAIREITGGGVQFSLETTAIPEVVRQAIDSLGVRGTCGIVGAAPPATEINIDVTEFMQMSKTVYGIIEGDSVPDIFIPTLIDLFLQGRFPFDKLTKMYPFEQINDAASDSEHGLTVKPIIRIGTI
ncbi:MAG: NAD(P)-dependent alcohol dehydrogenase [Hyphomicrobiales bacterium]|nr:NAD(P)-dependent alcohol dehydrogenase [Hyphomicrobiales bacterium]MDE1973376.1 NAD(P)-dependent alcohol dehydrogenase [Hyphomicrobiales bacterium]MDE2285294.1 NAD(P)-dependent alcohol dehydrogenase [Hyphomicrobiales bacterium]MDE2372880.1 NAD(P)-dependent alcohol dehydrogenase [Hyphomicrobiales bacterium]